MSDYIYSVVEGEAVRDRGDMRDLCTIIFSDFDADYLTTRLPFISDPALHVARRINGDLVGFKLGYRRGPHMFYSWLGGVHPETRRHGVARELMVRQHQWAADR